LAHSIFFFTYTTPTEISTLSLHDALPICRACPPELERSPQKVERSDPRQLSGRTVMDLRPLIVEKGVFRVVGMGFDFLAGVLNRSEEHTSELQSLAYLVCRLLLEKKKNV